MVFNKSVDSQFKSFQRGFLEGCPTHAWKMFLPDELMMLLHGEEIFKWEELREVKFETKETLDLIMELFLFAMTLKTVPRFGLC